MARSAADLLGYVGALLPDGRLTQAGAVAFCTSDRTWISTMVVDVEGGDVLAAAPDLTGLSLVGQVAATVQRLDVANTAVTLREGLVEEPVRRLPLRAVREAVLNGVVRRDWMSPEPVMVRWTEEDSALDDVSPGGFVGGVSAANDLSQRYARSAALADLFRALGLVDRGGMGVDRMVREMVVPGHRRPLLVELDGQYVRTRLVGGRPVVPMIELISHIHPASRPVGEMDRRPVLRVVLARTSKLLIFGAAVEDRCWRLGNGPLPNLQHRWTTVGDQGLSRAGQPPRARSPRAPGG